MNIFNNDSHKHKDLRVLALPMGSKRDTARFYINREVESLSLAHREITMLTEGVDGLLSCSVHSASTYMLRDACEPPVIDTYGAIIEVELEPGQSTSVVCRNLAESLVQLSGFSNLWRVFVGQYGEVDPITLNDIYAGTYDGLDTAAISTIVGMKVPDDALMDALVSKDAD